MVVTRFAPSPTGYLHIGGLRTALFSYLWARKNGGKFLLRIEDTDRSRNNEAATAAIIEAFKWIGLEHDGDIIYQSQRSEIYQNYINQLLEEGKAYRCYMSKEELNELREQQSAKNERPRYDGRYRDFDGVPPKGVEPVIRIKAPLEGTIEFEDGIKGSMSFDVNDILDDFVIARSDGTPTYNFVVSIDDALMGVNNVIRGDDHLSNTPKQIVVYRATGLEVPEFYHVPMIHNAEGRKLSKRDGATDVIEYRKDGFLPEALLNFLVRLGWSHGNQEIFSFSEMIELFNPQDINKSASIYNAQKLEWLNQHYIKNNSNSALVNLLEAYNIYLLSSDKKEIILDELKERSKTLKELAVQIKEITHTPQTYDEKAVKKALKGDAVEILEQFAHMLQDELELHLPSDYHEIMQKIVNKREIGFGKIGQPLRVALIGKLSGPGLDSVMAVIGKKATIERINALVLRVKKSATN